MKGFFFAGCGSRGGILHPHSTGILMDVSTVLKRKAGGTGFQ
jgi:hypothetical protein